VCLSASAKGRSGTNNLKRVKAMGIWAFIMRPVSKSIMAEIIREALGD